jgi:hypothetical protein
LGFFCAQSCGQACLSRRRRVQRQQARLAARLSFLGLRAAPVPASLPEGRQSMNLHKTCNIKNCFSVANHLPIVRTMTTPTTTRTPRTTEEDIVEGFPQIKPLAPKLNSGGAPHEGMTSLRMC